MYFRCINNVFSMYYQCIFNVLGVKYFGMVKYFFRLNYTNGVQSVPICAVQWIDFNMEKDSINCIIGRIPMSSWNELIPHPTLKNKPFISFNDLQPSRFALSYIPNKNKHAYHMEVSFMALDSEKLGEHVDDAYHFDFGDNMFPHYKGNRKTKSVFEEQDEDDSDSELEESELQVRRKTLNKLKEFMPQSILDFIID